MISTDFDSFAIMDRSGFISSILAVISTSRLPSPLESPDNYREGVRFLNFFNETRIIADGLLLVYLFFQGFWLGAKKVIGTWFNGLFLEDRAIKKLPESSFSIVTNYN